MTGPGSRPGDHLRGWVDALTEVIGSAATGDGGDHSGECRTCPICTGLAVLRGHRPDLSEALADLLTTAAAALRGLAHPVPADRAPADDVPPGPEPERPSPAPVQWIEVG